MDLVRFQLMIHYRAYRKLSWRVHEFLTHWGSLPFDILLDHLDSHLPSKRFDLPEVDSHFHQSVQRYVEITQDMYVAPNAYLVHANNAEAWIVGLKKLWSGIQDSLLVKSNDKWHVRRESPSPKKVKDIVLRLFVLETLMPMFEHLLSAHDVPGVLRKAGGSGQVPYPSLCLYVSQN